MVSKMIGWMIVHHPTRGGRGSGLIPRSVNSETRKCVVDNGPTFGASTSGWGITTAHLGPHPIAQSCDFIMGQSGARGSCVAIGVSVDAHATAAAEGPAAKERLSAANMIKESSRRNMTEQIAHEAEPNQYRRVMKLMS